MNRFVRIQNGAVAEASYFDSVEGRFHPSLVWIASDTAEIGDVWNGSEFVKPPSPAPVVPQSVTMRQARLALLGAGLLDDVDAAIAAIPNETQRRAAQIEWEYAAVVERNSPLIQQLAPALGMSAEQMDELFVAASGL